MTISTRSKVMANRLLLENPYAHIEWMERFPSDSVPADAVRRARLRLQNQYAYLEEIDGSSEKSAETPVRPSVWSFDAIESSARDMQRRLWQARQDLWLDDMPVSLATMLDPAKVCELLSYDFEVVASLGVYSDRQEQVAVAGHIDRRERVIRISRDFEPEVQLFTAAHEIGHLVLHPHIDRLHRDRGLNGLGVRRDRIELEADKFAVYFLLPERLVRKEFELRFLARKFILNDESLYSLRGRHGSGHGLKERRRLSRQLASAFSYNGRSFHSLASHFGVTTETMAIRLEELGIV